MPGTLPALLHFLVEMGLIYRRSFAALCVVICGRVSHDLSFVLNVLRVRKSFNSGNHAHAFVMRLSPVRVRVSAPLPGAAVEAQTYKILSGSVNRIMFYGRSQVVG